MSMPARAPIAKAASVQAANATRLVVPGQQQAEQPGGDRYRHGEQHQLGERPAPPPEALGPGVPEGAGLQLTGQHRRPDKRPDQRRHRLQDESIRQEVVHAVEPLDQVGAGK
jgi:hypothetical protein